MPDENKQIDWLISGLSKAVLDRPKSVLDRENESLYFNKQTKWITKRTCGANPTGESSSFIFTFSACLGSSTSDSKRIFRDPQLKQEKWPLYYLQSFPTNY